MSAKRYSPNTRITIAGFSAIILGFLLMGYLPYYRQCQRLEAQIAAHQGTQAEAARQSTQLKEVTRRAQLIRLAVRDYSRLVPANKDLGNFLEQLSQQLTAAGMQDTAVRALAPTALGKCEQLPIEIRGTGTYTQFREFLTHLEALPRMSSVSRLHIDSDSAGSGKLTVELTLSIYNTKSN